MNRVVRETVWRNDSDEDFVIDVGDGSSPRPCDARSLSGLGPGGTLVAAGVTRYVVKAGEEKTLPGGMDCVLSKTRLTRVLSYEVEAPMPTGSMIR